MGKRQHASAGKYGNRLGKAIPTTIIEEEQGAKAWHNQEYAEQDIDIELRNMSNGKARGGDGIPE